MWRGQKRREHTIVENSHAVVEGVFWQLGFHVLHGGFDQRCFWQWDLRAELRRRISVVFLDAAPLFGIAGKCCPAVFGNLFVARECHGFDA